MPTRLLLPTFLLFFLLSFAPAPVHAASASFLGPIVPPACNCENQPNPGGQPIATAPGLGCTFTVAQNIINFFISFACAVAALAFAYAGFLWILNPTNPEMRAQGRTMLLNIAIGLTIVLSAWLIIDFIMKKIYNENAPVGAGGAPLGPWNSILANDSAHACIAVTTAHEITGLPGPVTAITDGATNAPPGSTGTPGTPAPETTHAPTPAPSGHITFQTPGVSAQLPAISPALSTFLSCVAGRVPAGVGQISALTDSYSTTNQTRINHCDAVGSLSPRNPGGDPNCGHTVHSCHYGGRVCSGQSFAVDYGDGDPQHPSNLTQLRAASSACGALFMTDNEDGRRTHLHVSVGSCGCDGH